MGHDPQRGLSAHVILKSPSGCVVHAPDARRAVDLRADGLPQHLARAGHDAAELTVKLQWLENRQQGSESNTSLLNLDCIYSVDTVKGKGHNQ